MNVISKSIETQYKIKQAAEEMQNEIKMCYDWQKEMKDKEKNLKNATYTVTDESIGAGEGFDLPPVRSEMKSLKDHPEGNQSKKLDNNKIITAAEEIQAKALKSKEKGNEMVKIQKYDEAIYFYTDAINHFNADPIFYTNRALCYLKQERFEQCIDDCDKAISLNKSTVKAYYRRMLALECIGQYDKALADCKHVIKLEPKNMETRKVLKRISEKARKSNTKTTLEKPSFMNLTENMNLIQGYNKPAHLRSNKPLKRISIKETLGSKDDKNYENATLSNEQIPDDVIEKLFNNNISFKEIKKPKAKIRDKVPIHNMNADTNSELNISTNCKIEKYDNEKSTLPSGKTKSSSKIDHKFDDKIKKSPQGVEIPVPDSPAQFHMIWKELTLDEKFNFLKNIEVTKLNKVLGAGLEPDRITDIFEILHKYYIKNDLKVHEILLQISEHDEFSILSLFLSQDDRNILDILINYMIGQEVSEKIIEKIKHVYYWKEKYD